MADWLDLAGKRALVTGGASGIGLAIARGFLGQGAGVELVDRKPEVAAVAARLGEEFGRTVQAHAVDVRDRAALASIATMLRTERRALDIVVPNAGVNVRKPMLELEPHDVDEIIDTNLTGVVNTLQVFVPLIVGRPAPRVVVTSSVSATHGMTLRVVYGATKAGLSGLVRAAAVEWGPLGVTVNAVAPGVIRTPLTDAYMRAHPEREAAASTQTALGRVGTPEEVADAVLFLASRAARFVTGHALVVDGGLSAGINWW